MLTSLLIIDDDEEFSWLLAQYLRHKAPQLTVQCVATAESGLTIARELQPSVVLLDVHLPDRSGVELVPAIKRAAPAASVVMLSGSGDTRIVVSAIKLGADDYVQKPIDHAQLWDKLHAVVEN